MDRVPVVFLWCLAALSVACATHGLPSLTHQRQDDGDIRAPTLRGWCCGSCRARVSATVQVFHVRVILLGAACRLGQHGDVRDVFFFLTMCT